ncbi:Uncharacterised protein [Bordetella pertussis]|nr:Uncharacterised protein [Bordetella pertussis]
MVDLFGPQRRRLQRTAAPAPPSPARASAVLPGSAVGRSAAATRVRVPLSRAMCKASRPARGVPWTSWVRVVAGRRKAARTKAAFCGSANGGVVLANCKASMAGAAWRARAWRAAATAMVTLSSSQ